jgi:hypothetical protein
MSITPKRLFEEMIKEIEKMTPEQKTKVRESIESGQNKTK